MIKSLTKINKIKNHKDISKEDKWLKYLYSTREKNYNLNNLKSLSELTNKSVLNYVIKALKILDEENTNEENIYYIEETLKWMDVAKCGSKLERKIWKEKGYDLFVHNIGSSQIYKEHSNSYDDVVEVLIRTHGLVGQYLKGEVILHKNKELYDLIAKELIEKEKLRDVLYILNKCIIKAISHDLWDKLKDGVESTIDKIVNNQFEEYDYCDTNYIINRFSKLKKGITNEEIEWLNKLLSTNYDLKDKLSFIFKELELWYVEAITQNFRFEEVIKTFYIIGVKLEKKNYKHLSFENVMKMIYLDYKKMKVTNLYKERIIESYLKNLSYEQIKNGDILNDNLNINLEYSNDTVLFNYNFSIAAHKLIEFCEIAYETDSLFNKAVFMLYDLFNFRRDEYDRFYNEIKYLRIMNESLSQKSKILEYIKGRSILDIGPGGGALMDLVTEKFPDANVYGIDISQNVIEELKLKKERENRKWNIVKGDALELSKYFKNNEIDTIIYSSIIHELFSYISFDNKKFNYKTIEKALKSAYDILPKKGRIIIRDGIMTENKNMKRIIKFNNKEDIKILDRYCNDFKGRKIEYSNIREDEVLVNVNDAMEFLYTYTWGEESYSLEVKEQFGYFTPNEYINFIQEIFNNKCKIIECLNFLQDGYEEHLLEKIDFYDENHKVVSLPDSTCIIVIEKI